jgi:hypothetical protein
MATTRIFEVVFNYVEEFDGKGEDAIEGKKSVTAKNAEDAIGKVRAIMAKSSSYFDDESKKRVKVTNNHFDPIGVSLEAEATREY